MSKIKFYLYNISLLGISQIVKVIFRFFVFAFLARNLGPYIYGNYVTILAFVDFFIVFTLPGITKPIIREGSKNIKNLSNILNSKIWIRNFLAIFAIAICNIVNIFTSYPLEIKLLISLYSLNLIIESLRTFLQTTYKVLEKFKFISIVDLVQTIFYFIFISIALYLKLSLILIVIITLSSNIVATLLDIIITNKLVQIKFFDRLDLNKKFIISSMFFTLTNIFWLLTTRIDVVVISFLGSSQEVGIYNVANRLVINGLKGMSIISTTIFPAIVRKTYKNSLNLFPYKKKIIYFFLGVLIIFFFLFIFSHDIIPYIFGEAYYDSIKIFNILLIYLYLQIIANPITLILQAMNQEKKLMLATLPLPIINILADLLFYNIFGLVGIAYSTILVYSIYLATILIINKKILREKIIL